MENIEIKVRVEDPEELLERALALGARHRDRFDDIDTYFPVPHGRLKLRMSDRKKAGTLIYYERADEEVSRVSNYRLVHVPDGNALLESLSLALGVLVTVKKSRTLIIWANTRIHFDEVEGLGSFFELETVVTTQSMTEARDEHDQIVERLKLASYEIIPGSYSDLLLNAR